MSILNSIKHSIRQYTLRKITSSQTRKRKLINLKKAGFIGVLFEVHDDISYQHVHQYIQSLQDMKIKVKAVGYVREKHLAARFLTVLSFDFVYEKDLNWYGKPKSKRVEEFWQTEFDICINISSPDCFPMKYIACKSLAHLKVGPFTEPDKEFYDLLIHPSGNHDQVRFLGQVNEYLSILNPKENA